MFPGGEIPGRGSFKTAVGAALAGLNVLLEGRLSEFPSEGSKVVNSLIKELEGIQINDATPDGIDGIVTRLGEKLKGDEEWYLWVINDLDTLMGPFFRSAHRVMDHLDSSRRPPGSYGDRVARAFRAVEETWNELESILREYETALKSGRRGVTGVYKVLSLMEEIRRGTARVARYGLEERLQEEIERVKNDLAAYQSDPRRVAERVQKLREKLSVLFSQL